MNAKTIMLAACRPFYDAKVVRDFRRVELKPVAEIDPNPPHNLHVERHDPAYAAELRWRDSTARDHVASQLGLVLPSANRWTPGRLQTLWLGPCRYVLLGAMPPAPPCERKGARLFDVSGSWAGFGIIGPRAAELLGHGMPLDLRPRAFPPDGCARTWFGHHHVIVRRRRDGFEILCRAHAAEWFDNWFADALAGHDC